MDISYDDLKTDSEISTLIFSINSQYSDSVLNSLVESLREKKYVVRSKLVNNAILTVTIFQDNQKVGTIESHYVWLVSRLSSALCEEVIQMLKTDFNYFGQIVCRVPHTDKETILNDNLSMKVRSGIINSTTELIPHTIFFLYEKQCLIGKVLIKYFNSDMGEYEPAILIMEISNDMQDKSGVFLQLIEQELRQGGFVKLWVKDIQNDNFWKKHHYQIDDSQAVKYLQRNP